MTTTRHPQYTTDELPEIPTELIRLGLWPPRDDTPTETSVTEVLLKATRDH